MSNCPVIIYEVRNGRYTPLAELQRNDGVERDAWGNPRPFVVRSESPIGEEVIVTKPGDQNEGREGPIWSVYESSGNEGEAEEVVEVWFEDGIRNYGWDDLEETGGRSIDISNLPEIRPDNGGITPSTTTCDEVGYQHPYHIHPKNQ